jgi:hypothetical protein
MDVRVQQVHRDAEAPTRLTYLARAFAVKGLVMPCVRCSFVLFHHQLADENFAFINSHLAMNQKDTY